MAETKKRKHLSISDKVEILHELENGKSNSALYKQFNLRFSTVSTIWKNRASIIKVFEKNNGKLKKMRTCERNDGKPIE